MKRFIKISATISLALILLVSCAIASFLIVIRPPSEREIDQKLIEYSQETDPNQREEIIFKLLDRMVGKDHKNFQRYSMTLDKMVLLYKKKNDLSMLKAVDRIDPDTAFWTETCVFYRKIKDEPGFKKRYSIERNRNNINGCGGFSFNKESSNDALK